MKILFIDTETTGLDPKVNGIHQLAGEIMIDGVVVNDFEYYISPFSECEVNTAALDISNTSSFDLLIYPEEQYVFSNFRDMVGNYMTQSNDKFFLAGWRFPEFDSKFLAALFERNDAEVDFKSFYWSNPIDVKVLATQYLINKRQDMESFSLVSVAKYLGIEVDETKLHSAAYDAYLCRKIYEIVTSL